MLKIIKFITLKEFGNFIAVYVCVCVCVCEGGVGGGRRGRVEFLALCDCM